VSYTSAAPPLDRPLSCKSMATGRSQRLDQRVQKLGRDGSNSARVFLRWPHQSCTRAAFRAA